MQTIDVAVVEDARDTREALYLLLRGTPGFSCTAAFATAEEALVSIPKLKPDVVLMDIHLPGVSGIDCIRALKPVVPRTRFMVLSVFEDHDRIFAALRAGAQSYVLKKTPFARLLDAIHELHHGGAPMSPPIAAQVIAAFHESPRVTEPDAQLSPRENQILGLLNQGLLYKEIAGRLGISMGTVRTHIARIYEKLHVRSRAQAMLKAARR